MAYSSVYIQEEAHNIVVRPQPLCRPQQRGRRGLAPHQRRPPQEKLFRFILNPGEKATGSRSCHLFRSQVDVDQPIHCQGAFALCTPTEYKRM
ncbi:hypothetical protein BC936DRAFT_139025 [Jimgerdemannia flammicorona]|uniref:Uncharacterized protein n=1 Tax=Jimgerdemannia flammicorona TaxID=994334 RepID=A0A433BAT9_9FUNG|nr:hypothetical protein BC936DRAFT_139025 [Jimgerdemannia flammicorona]